MWSGCLLEDLAWYRQYDDRNLVPIRQQYIAPSFSWASLQDEMRGVEFLTSFYEEENTPYRSVWGASISNYNVKLSGHEAFGRVEDGHISIHTYIIPATCRMVAPQSDYDRLYEIRSPGVVQIWNTPRFQPDATLTPFCHVTSEGKEQRSLRRKRLHEAEFPSASEELPVVYLCYLCAVKILSLHEHARQYFLVLGAVPGEPSKFQRIGFSSVMYEPPWELEPFSSEFLKTITIV